MSKESLITKVNEVIQNEIRPMLQGDGGEIEVGQLRDDGILELIISGNCVHCSSLPLTLTFGIEEKLKAVFPEIKGVIQLQ